MKHRFSLPEERGDRMAVVGVTALLLLALVGICASWAVSR